MAVEPERETTQARPDPDRCEVRSVDPEKVRRAQEMLLPEETYGAMAQSFSALADPSRTKIVYCLLHQELCVCDLSTVVGLSESAVSQHLRLLRTLHVVKSRREGKVVYYSLDDAHVRVLLSVSMDHVQHTLGFSVDPRGGQG
jgi:ArsR family transcriptional regulator, lead/cadmium/zinc/bismuth-responsive transcriptional repressor